MSNISEGFESGTDKQFSRFLNIAKGSSGGCRAQQYIALDQNYIDKLTFKKLKSDLLDCSRMLSKLISYLTSNDNNRDSSKI